MENKPIGINSVMQHLVMPILLAAGHKKRNIIEAMAVMVRNYKDGD